MARNREVTAESIADAKRRGLVPQSGDWQKPKRWIKPNLCVHHWDIESSNGPLSRGECRKCMEKRDFFNSIQSSETWSIPHFSKRAGRETIYRGTAHK